MLSYGSELQKATATQSFWNAYYGIPTPFDGLVYERQSTQKTDTYTRLGAAPMPTEWVGDRKAKDVNEYNFDVTNVPYDATVRVDKELIKYQQWDEVGNLVGNLGAKAKAHKTSLHTALLVANGTCEDGTAFFGDTHLDPGAIYTTGQDNNLTGAAATATQPTDVEFRDAIQECIAAFYGFKDDRGDPAVPEGTNPANLVAMVPPAYHSIAQAVMRSSNLTGPISNDVQGIFTAVTNPFMTAVDRFWMFYGGGAHKPVVLQTTDGLELADDIDPHNGDTLYSATWWGASAYGQWRTAILYIFT